MNLTVIGTGYVGLVTGTCFAEMGHSVTCVDVDSRKVENLKKGVLPIYEPGLDAMVERNAREGRLAFTTSLPEAMRSSDVFFIAVGTPPGEDGSADLQYVLAVAREIGAHMDRYAVVIDKSTVPVGTAEKVRAAIDGELERRGRVIDFDVVSNPEFLKEGAAIADFMKPDRIVIGAESERAVEIMRELYAEFTRSRDRLLIMGIRDAEMTKYVANAMLATKISFMNEVANLCDRMGVDVENVRTGIGSDSRIGYYFIYPGCGYGGSCFPKDVKALIRMAAAHDFHPRVLEAVEARNEEQKGYLFGKISAHYGSNLQGRVFGLWGVGLQAGDRRHARGPFQGPAGAVDPGRRHGARVRSGRDGRGPRGAAPGVVQRRTGDPGGSPVRCARRRRCLGAGDRVAPLPPPRLRRHAPADASRPGDLRRPQPVPAGEHGGGRIRLLRRGSLNTRRAPGGETLRRGGGGAGGFRVLWPRPDRGRRPPPRGGLAVGATSGRDCPGAGSRPEAAPRAGAAVGATSGRDPSVPLMAS
jgi:UDPglucose 6-dehydrogenase